MHVKNSKVLIVVPAYNEAENIERVVKTLGESGFDYVVINDGSTDDTEAILQRLGASHIQLVRNLGIGGAVQTGYLYAHRHGYEAAVQFDGDGQHDINYVAPLVEPILSGRADIVLGSRFVGECSEFKSSAARRMGIRILSFAIQVATGEKLYDVTSGFRAMGPKAIKMFSESYPSDYPEPESLAYAISHGLKVQEIPVEMHERQGGSSSIGGLNAVWYMLKVGLMVLMRGSYLHRGSKS